MCLPRNFRHWDTKWIGAISLLPCRYVKDKIATAFIFGCHDESGNLDALL